MITDKVKYITSIALVVVGLGLCIGGIFFTPLFALGGPLITAGLSLLGITFAAKDSTPIIFRSRRSPRAEQTQPATPPEPTTPPITTPILTFSNNYHVGINNAAPTRPNTPSDEGSAYDESMHTAQDSSPRMGTLSNR